MPLHALGRSYRAVVGASHSWVRRRSRRAIWSPQAGAASSSSQARADLALASYSPHVCVCVVQIGWRQWWHSRSCGWLVFPRLQHSHPSRGQIWGRGAEWACSEILISSGKVKHRWGLSLRASLQRTIKWKDTIFFFYIIFWHTLFPAFHIGMQRLFSLLSFLSFFQ